MLPITLQKYYLILALFGFHCWILFCQPIRKYHVAKNGSDGGDCGDITAPCGTLYFVSLCIANSSNIEWIINIVDGQNKAAITQYIHSTNTKYDPCLPKPFSADKHISIQFMGEQTMSDWLPQNICNQNSGKYLNRFIFDGGFYLYVHNWKVYNYVMDTIFSYGLIGNYQIDNSSVICDNCVFKDIVCKSNHLLATESNLYLVNSTFINITSSKEVIQHETPNLQNKNIIPRVIFQETTVSHIIT
eukprot:152200_1